RAQACVTSRTWASPPTAGPSSIAAWNPLGPCPSSSCTPLTATAGPGASSRRSATCADRRSTSPCSPPNGDTAAILHWCGKEKLPNDGPASPSASQGPRPTVHRPDCEPAPGDPTRDRRTAFAVAPRGTLAVAGGTPGRHGRTGAGGPDVHQPLAVSTSPRLSRPRRRVAGDRRSQLRWRQLSAAALPPGKGAHSGAAQPPRRP